jgi:hypothetical protein
MKPTMPSIYDPLTRKTENSATAEQRQDIEQYPLAQRWVNRVLPADRNRVMAYVGLSVPPAVRDQEVAAWLAGLVAASDLPDGWEFRETGVVMRDYAGGAE